MSWEQLMQEPEEETPGFLNDMMRRLRPARWSPTLGRRCSSDSEAEDGKTGRSFAFHLHSGGAAEGAFCYLARESYDNAWFGCIGREPPGAVQARPPPEPPALGSVTLGDKLAAKRQALKPFGGTPSETSAPTVAAACAARGSEEADRPPGPVPVEGSLSWTRTCSRIKAWNVCLNSHWTCESSVACRCMALSGGAEQIGGLLSSICSVPLRANLAHVHPH